MKHRKKRSSLFSILYVCGDFISIVLGFVLAYVFRFHNPLVSVKDIPSFGFYLISFLISAAIFVVLFRYFKLYQPSSMLRRWDIAMRSIYAITFGLVIVMAVTFIYRSENFDYSRLMVVFSWFFLIICFNFMRFFINKRERSYIKKNGLETRVVILGINRLSRQIIDRIKQARYSGYRIVGIYTIEGTEIGAHIQNCKILGHLSEFEGQIDGLDIDEVILTHPALSREKTAELMLCCEERMIQFKVIADLYGMVTSAVEVQYLNTIPLLGIKPLPLDDLWNRIVKRSFDLLFSGLGLVALSPLLVLAALRIKLEDGGPVFYLQERVGRGGKIFNLVKFRTMIPNAEATTGPVWTSADDSRMSKVGEFLRRTNIDELPQLWNVFIGDMSLVGPRPERPHFVEEFKSQVPRYMSRHSLKAGITGWAQVHGYRGDVNTGWKGREKTKIGIQERDHIPVSEKYQLLTERIQLDLYYSENWSLLFDFEIILRTFAAYKNAF